MAKKIALDFSKVEERSGWNTKEMPEGLHEFKIELVDDKDANDGTSMWTYGLRPTNPKYKTRLFPYYCKHQANQLWKLRDLFVAAGIPVPKKKVNLDPNAPIGKLIAGDVGPGTGNFSDRSEISGVYDTSILEDDGAASDDEDEVDEDEVDDEAEEVEDDEEYDDEEEEGDDELREEIEGLTLAALRKRAKGLDIDTDGVKKDELVELVIEAELEGEEDSDEEDDLDDEDLDDEELEDEDFDDEEEEDEEPEPVKPARRAAPARKPAAKAAPAAAARRTVKRR